MTYKGYRVWGKRSKELTLLTKTHGSSSSSTAVTAGNTWILPKKLQPSHKQTRTLRSSGGNISPAHSERVRNRTENRLTPKLNVRNSGALCMLYVLRRAPCWQVIRKAYA
jgi:hypothetical protein